GADKRLVRRARRRPGPPGGRARPALTRPAGRRPGGWTPCATTCSAPTARPPARGWGLSGPANPWAPPAAFRPRWWDRRGPLLADLLDHLVDARDVVVLDERRERVHARVLLRFVLAAPAVPVVLRHVEDAERDHLVLVAHVARVVDALQSGRVVAVAGIPGVAELVPGTWLEPAGGEEHEH